MSTATPATGLVLPFARRSPRPSQSTVEPTLDDADAAPESPVDIAQRIERNFAEYGRLLSMRPPRATDEDLESGERPTLRCEEIEAARGTLDQDRRLAVAAGSR